MNKKLQELIDKYNVVIIMRFGSHLYGTNTPESDEDYKGIFLPTKEEILLQKVPKHIKADSKNNNKEKNTKDDVDIELYSLNYFIELACKGETVAIDMLHCNKENIVYATGITWAEIQLNKNKFYTNNLKGFVGYCRKQAAKYGIKGSRIADARKVYDFLYHYNVNIDRLAIMSDVWKQLPKGEHIHFVTSGKKDSDEEFYQVCGKKLQKTSKIVYCMEILKNFIDSYGHRALLAEKNEGIDWKAISHAIRYGMQIKELFETGDIKFPLKEKEYLKKVKAGELNYLKEVAPVLEAIMDEIEILSTESDLANKPNRKFWNYFLIETHENIIKKEIK